MRERRRGKTITRRKVGDFPFACRICFRNGNFKGRESEREKRSLTRKEREREGGEGDAAFPLESGSKVSCGKGVENRREGAFYASSRTQSLRVSEAQLGRVWTIWRPTYLSPAEDLSPTQSSIRANLMGLQFSKLKLGSSYFRLGRVRLGWVGSD